jgi:hypothetical protein
MALLQIVAACVWRNEERYLEVRESGRRVEAGRWEMMARRSSGGVAVRWSFGSGVGSGVESGWVVRVGGVCDLLVIIGKGSERDFAFERGILKERLCAETVHHKNCV